MHPNAFREIYDYEVKVNSITKINNNRYRQTVTRDTAGFRLPLIRNDPWPTYNA